MRAEAVSRKFQAVYASADWETTAMYHPSYHGDRVVILSHASGTRYGTGTKDTT